MIMSTINPLHERLKYVDFTTNIASDSLVLLIPTNDDMATNTTAVVKPFKWLV